VVLVVYRADNTQKVALLKLTELIASLLQRRVINPGVTMLMAALGGNGGMRCCAAMAT
jgi:hypothetical protein